MDYVVSIKTYEGPIELLLDLIKQNEIDIYDIPINLITSQFLEYISMSKILNMDLTSDFLLMAASLIEIKSKMLLPKEELFNDEDENYSTDPREELVKKILEYEKYREVSTLLKESFDFEIKSIYKLPEDFSNIDKVEFLKNLKVDSLQIAFTNILNKIEKKETVHKISVENFSTEMAMSDIKERLKTNSELSFFDTTKNSSIEVVVSYFLSILELAKLGLIGLKQTDDLEDIVIYRREYGL